MIDEANISKEMETVISMISLITNLLLDVFYLFFILFLLLLFFAARCISSQEDKQKAFNVFFASNHLP